MYDTYKTIISLQKEIVKEKSLNFQTFPVSLLRVNSKTAPV